MIDPTAEVHFKSFQWSSALGVRLSVLIVFTNPPFVWVITVAPSWSLPSRVHVTTACGRDPRLEQVKSVTTFSKTLTYHAVVSKLCSPAVIETLLGGTGNSSLTTKGVTENSWYKAIYVVCLHTILDTLYMHSLKTLAVDLSIKDTKQFSIVIISILLTYAIQI